MNIPTNALENCWEWFGLILNCKPGGNFSSIDETPVGSTASASALKNCTRNLTGWVGGCTKLEWTNLKLQWKWLSSIHEDSEDLAEEILVGEMKAFGWALWWPTIGGSTKWEWPNLKLQQSVWIVHQIHCKASKNCFLRFQTKFTVLILMKSQCWPHENCLLWFQRKFTVLILV